MIVQNDSEEWDDNEYYIPYTRWARHDRQCGNEDDNEYYIPYTATYIDDEKLIVGIDPAVLSINWPCTSSTSLMR